MNKPTITPKEKKILREDYSYGNWKVVQDDIFLYQDHGYDHMMCVIRNPVYLGFYAFTYEQTGDETFYDQDDCELVEVEEVKTTTYRPKTNKQS